MQTSLQFANMLSSVWGEETLWGDFVIFKKKFEEGVGIEKWGGKRNPPLKIYKKKRLIVWISLRLKQPKLLFKVHRWIYYISLYKIKKIIGYCFNIMVTNMCLYLIRIRFYSCKNKNIFIFFETPNFNKILHHLKICLKC